MDEDLLGVVAHGWVNTMAVVSGAGATLAAFQGQLSDDQRDELLSLIRTHGTYLQAEISVTIRCITGTMVEAGVRP